MSEVKFKKTRLATELVKDGGEIFILIPSKKFGTREKVDLKGKVNGTKFALTAVPWKGDNHALIFEGELKSLLSKDKDGEVVIEFQLDTTLHPEVKVPEDLQKAMAVNYDLYKKFTDLPYYKKSTYVDWIDDSENDEVRAERVQKALTLIEHDKLPK